MEQVVAEHPDSTLVQLYQVLITSFVLGKQAAELVVKRPAQLLYDKLLTDQLFGKEV